MSADFYERALWRIRLFTVLVGLTGSMVLLVAQGVRPAAGFLAGAGWVAAGIGIVALFEHRSWKYVAINGGYLTVALTVMGAILGGWR